MLGGISTSPSFTEDPTCANGLGCVFVTNWSSDTESFSQKWLFKTVSSIREIVFKPDAAPERAQIFALVFDLMSLDNTSTFKTVLNFSTWQGKRAAINTEMHTINELADKAAMNDFTKLSIWEGDIFHTIVNNANNWQVTDYFYIFDPITPNKVKKVWG